MSILHPNFCVHFDIGAAASSKPILQPNLCG
jgi:hypothetical protein